LNVLWDDQSSCNGSAWIGTTGKCRDNPDGWIEGGSGHGAPETEIFSNNPSHVNQVTWNSPISNKVLLDVGWSRNGSRWGAESAQGRPHQGLIQVEQQGSSHSRPR